MDRRTFVAVPLAWTAVSAMRREAIAAPGPIDFTSQLPAPGSFPAKWICGSPSCMDNHDPPIQVHWYNEHTVFMRQNKAYSYEAPFMHLYFGNDRILMLDQGFTQLRSDWDLRRAVDDCIDKWCARHRRNARHGRPDFPTRLCAGVFRSRPFDRAAGPEPAWYARRVRAHACRLSGRPHCRPGESWLGAFRGRDDREARFTV